LEDEKGKYRVRIETEVRFGDQGKLDMPGVEICVLRRDEATGGQTVLTRIAPGGMIPAHSHTRADESVHVVEGEFVEYGEVYGPGSYIYGRTGTTHGPHSPPGRCIVLTHFSAELDFVPAEGPTQRRSITGSGS
jgi:anti-sigma factor ChrR (cupin superfamily)